MLQTANFKLDVDAAGRGTIEINGEDYTPLIEAWQIVGGGPQHTTLIVRMVPGAAAITGEGVVQVEVPHDADAICTWLAELDPQAVEEAVLEASGNPAYETPGQAWLGVLSSMAADTPRRRREIEPA